MNQFTLFESILVSGVRCQVSGLRRAEPEPCVWGRSADREAPNPEPVNAYKTEYQIFLNVKK